MRIGRVSVLISWVLVLLVFGPSADAQPGALDPNFGNGGIVVTPEGAGYAMAVQPDGKILAAGYIDGAADGLAVARYLPNGDLDTTFGSAGIASLEPGLGQASTTTRAVAVQPDGRILLTGDDYGYIAVGRLEQDGTPDQSFGSDGLVQTPIEPRFDPAGLLVEPDGKIVVDGRGSLSGDRYTAATLARYVPDGTLDPTFGSGGIVQIRRPSLSMGRMAPGPEGTILAAVTEGYSRGPGHPASTLGVARFTSTGVFDRSFGQGGVALGAFDRNTAGSAIALQSDGRIVVAGTYVTVCCVQRQRFAVARFNADGTADSSFSHDGWTTTLFPRCLPPEAEGPSVIGTSVAVQPNGRIVVGGYLYDNQGGCGPGDADTEVALVRYQPWGARDKKFGRDGRVVTATYDGAYCFDLAVLPTYRILVVGIGSQNAHTGGMLLAQYLAT
jgi:uncharacterized delta-60 repeat protein